MLLILAVGEFKNNMQVNRLLQSAAELLELHMGVVANCCIFGCSVELHTPAYSATALHVRRSGLAQLLLVIITQSII